MNDLIQILEHILESDPRTFMNQDHEYGWVFDRVHDALKKAKEIELAIENIIKELDK